MIRNSIQLLIKKINFFDNKPMIVCDKNIFLPNNKDFKEIKRTIGSDVETTLLYVKDGNGIFLKCQFELLFDYDPGCINYDINRIVYYPKSLI